MSKKEIVELISKYKSIVSCPICSTPMQLDNSKSLVCTNNHCFDLAKHGYVNLLPHSVKTKYDKRLFESRKMLSKSGFYDPLDDQIIEYIEDKLKIKNGALKIIDAGCGDGSHLSSIHQKISQKNTSGFLGVGVDISKEGIIFAAKDYPHAIWCVADLAKSPFADKQFDVILNILSPSNYAEFKRLLTDDGIVIKVIPGNNYLKELRDTFYESTDKEEYSNEKTIELFHSNLDLIEIKPIRYTKKLDNTLVEHLINMTPLSWNVDEERVKKVLKMGSLEITIDLAILVGRKN